MLEYAEEAKGGNMVEHCGRNKSSIYNNPPISKGDKQLSINRVIMEYIEFKRSPIEIVNSRDSVEGV